MWSSNKQTKRGGAFTPQSLSLLNSVLETSKVLNDEPCVAVLKSACLASRDSSIHKTNNVNNDHQTLIEWILTHRTNKHEKQTLEDRAIEYQIGFCVACRDQPRFDTWHPVP